ncbi:hypothetical protein BS50DRAFT_624589 [Corynespora cassiicola Philippines]|uniref:Uncharacterized protein n=1 Tax=Corynespora cassiicola Philippines TaxID=1448308 RepID=A0A2T2NCM2_CORCC|nr:hypothetical protein BS50DRAFT_624589 [Corynespora cassiicola Philippines]
MDDPEPREEIRSTVRMIDDHSSLRSREVDYELEEMNSYRVLLNSTYDVEHQNFEEDAERRSLEQTHFEDVSIDEQNEVENSTFAHGSSGQSDSDQGDFGVMGDNIHPPLMPPPMDSLPISASVTKTTDWLPITLTRWYLLSLSTLSLALGVCCFTLASYSHMHHGLSLVGSTTQFRFNQKFFPTLVAVLYTLLWKPVVVNVVKTEPWALLSLSSGSKAQDSILKTDTEWWNHVAYAIRNRKHPGGVRWALLISIISGLVASILINPLSAGLFDTLNLLVTDIHTFSGIDPATPGTQSLRIGDATYLRAITNILFDVSTSAWNTDQYTVTPFWPSDFSEAPMNASLAQLPQIWEAEREVLAAQVRCTPFTKVINSTEKDLLDLPSPELQTDDGCSIVFDVGSPFCGNGVWRQISLTSLKEDSPQGANEKCTALGYREYFVFCSFYANSTGMEHRLKMGSHDVLYYTGQVCSTEYLAAYISVTVSTNSSESTVSLNRTNFNEAARQMDGDYLDVKLFESEFVLQTGSNHLRPAVGNALATDKSLENKQFGGPTLVLASSNNYSVEGLMQMDPEELANQTAIMKQRFLGEVLLSGFQDVAHSSNVEQLQAAITKIQARLVVDLGIGITIGILFILLAGAAASLAFLTNLSKRPLQLVSDPSKSSNIAMILKDSKASMSFKDLDRVPPTQLENILQDHSYLMRTGKLIRIDDNSPVPSSNSQTSKEDVAKRNWLCFRKTSGKSTKQDWRPFTLQRKSGSSLTLFLLCVLTALITIYALSLKRPLYQSAFVYNSEIEFGNLQVTTLAPYGIIPTLVAVGIKLWWATIDSVYRRLSPFLAMARSPMPKASEGASLSFVTTPIVWITLLALRKGRWLLALVTFGSLLSEVLQISMSALWNREPGVVEVDTTLNAQFQIRSVDHLFEDFRAAFYFATDIAYPNIAQHLYGGQNYQTSWIYGSLAELVFGASPPLWSKDTWNFPPVDLGGVSGSIPNIPTFDQTESSRSIAESYLNVTFESTGLRGRIECFPIDDWSRWVLEVNDLADIPLHASIKNTTRPNITTGFEFTPEVRVVEFTKSNGSLPTTVSIGQWLHYNYSSIRDRGEPLYDPEYPKNFTVLWANASYPYLYRGNGRGSFSDPNPPPRLIFAEKPQVQALNCLPIFETSEMEIVVDANEEKIQKYTVSRPINPMEDAWAHTFTRHFSNETAYYTPPRESINDLIHYNSTVSWGYLFQLALLQACNVQGSVIQGDYFGEGVPGVTPFSFIEPDLYSDPYSYAALAQVGYDRAALLNATTLTSVTQLVFSTFFQWFASSKSGYEGDYWAYQPFDESLPPDLDFGPVESWVTEVVTETSTLRLCDISTSSDKPTPIDGAENSMGLPFQPACTGGSVVTSFSVYTETLSSLTIPDTRPSSASKTTKTSRRTAASTGHTLTQTSSTRSATRSAPRSSSQLAKRATTTPTDDPRIIPAKISVRTEILAISPVALFLSVSIIFLLIAFTLVIYSVQNRSLRMIPRDFDSPASVMAAVYASDKLKAWAERRHEDRQIENTNGRWRKRELGPTNDGDDVRVKMGYFTSAEGEEHWGIEVVDEHRPLLDKSSPEDDTGLDSRQGANP